MKNPSAKKVPTQVPRSPSDVDVKDNPVFTIGWKCSWVGDVSLPLGVAVDKDGNIAVFERGNKRFQVFDRNTGQSLRSFPVDGEKPYVLKDGCMVVAVPNQHSCLLLQPDGSLIWDIGKWKLQVPVFMSVDESCDVMFATDETAHKVFAFDLGGNLMFDFGKEGENNGEFKSPCGVTTDPEGNIIVGNAGDGRVHVFAPDRTFKQKVGTVKRGYAI
ncbi:hypothetical protein Bbelb_347750 [Branchiostoma belcheri]|nr:hypothetical protein Bbelb_347750 [Branchiostoma belcheri]